MGQKLKSNDWVVGSFGVVLKDMNLPPEPLGFLFVFHEVGVLLLLFVF